MLRDHFIETDLTRINDFTDLLNLICKDSNAKAKAVLKLRQLKQKSKTCNEYIVEFKALISEAGIIRDLSLIQFYQDMLNVPLCYD